MPTEVEFLARGIAFKLKHQKKITSWLVSIARKEGRAIESLTYIFATDPFVATINQQYLRHNTYTDIITFDYSEPKGPIIGEIYISVPRVRDNSRTYEQPFDQELRRVMVHGLLHILGYGDKTPREKSKMRSKEEACLSLWA